MNNKLKDILLLLAAFNLVASVFAVSGRHDWFKHAPAMRDHLRACLADTQEQQSRALLDGERVPESQSGPADTDRGRSLSTVAAAYWVRLFDNPPRAGSWLRVATDAAIFLLIGALFLSSRSTASPEK